jgi:cyanophycinase
VVVVPAAAAFERPERVVERAVAHLEALGATVRPLMVLHRTEAEDPKIVDVVKRARFVYLCDGSPLHLRSVLRASALWDAIHGAYRHGAVLAASGAGATLVCDPMIDPRGGAYTVGLRLVADLAVFPYHGSAADHLRARSLDLLPSGATLVGIDERTALIRDPGGSWRCAGDGNVSVYAGPDAVEYRPGTPIPGLSH